MKNKRIDLKAILCQNVTAFLTKTLPSFFEMQEKLKTYQNSNSKNFRKPSSER